MMIMMIFGYDVFVVSQLLFPQSASETISIKSKVIEDQTDSIRKLKQVSILNSDSN